MYVYIFAGYTVLKFLAVISYTESAHNMGRGGLCPDSSARQYNNTTLTQTNTLIGFQNKFLLSLES
jgi:hypothetical protein